MIRETNANGQIIQDSAKAPVLCSFHDVYLDTLGLLAASTYIGSSNNGISFSLMNRNIGVLEYVNAIYSAETVSRRS